MREAGEQTTYSSCVHPWFLTTESLDCTHSNFQAFAQPREQSTPFYINWTSLITTLLARLEAVAERQKIEGDDKIKISQEGISQKFHASVLFLQIPEGRHDFGHVLDWLFIMPEIHHLEVSCISSPAQLLYFFEFFLPPEIFTV